MNTKQPTTGNPATATTNGNITPAQLLTYEKEYLIEEIRHQLKNMGHLFSVSLSHPVDDDDKEALMYLAWEKAEHAKTLLHKLEQLIQEPAPHAHRHESNATCHTTVTHAVTNSNANRHKSHGGNP